MTSSRELKRLRSSIEDRLTSEEERSESYVMIYWILLEQYSIFRELGADEIRKWLDRIRSSDWPLQTEIAERIIAEDLHRKMAGEKRVI